MFDITGFRSTFFAITVALGFVSRAHAGVSPKDILISITGFSSCREETNNTVGLNKMGPLLERARDSLNKANGNTTAIVAGCFDVRSAGFGKYLLYFIVRTRNPEGVETSFTLDLRGLFAGGGKLKEFDILLDAVEKVVLVLAGNSQPRVHIWGHSYGGWTAIKLVERFYHNAAGPTPVTLATIDAISPLYCNARSMVISGPLVSPGCVQPPADIEMAEQVQLAKMVKGRWKNFYQTQFYRLHSGPFDYLTSFNRNEKVRIESRNPFFNNQHMLITSDTHVWAEIEKQIALFY